MGLSITAYGLLAVSGTVLYLLRTGSLGAGNQKSHEKGGGAIAISRPIWLRPLHFTLGGIMVALVLLLLSIGVIGTLGEYGNLGHSVHLPAGIIVVTLTLASAWSATRISPQRPWARKLHLSLNGVLFLAFVTVTATGWNVVQKYL